MVFDLRVVTDAMVSIHPLVASPYILAQIPEDDSETWEMFLSPSLSYLPLFLKNRFDNDSFSPAHVSLLLFPHSLEYLFLLFSRLNSASFFEL